MQYYYVKSNQVQPISTEFPTKMPSGVEVYRCDYDNNVLHLGRWFARKGFQLVLDEGYRQATMLICDGSYAHVEILSEAERAVLAEHELVLQRQAEAKNPARFINTNAYGENVYEVDLI